MCAIAHWSTTETRKAKQMTAINLTPDQADHIRKALLEFTTSDDFDTNETEMNRELRQKLWDMLCSAKKG